MVRLDPGEGGMLVGVGASVTARGRSLSLVEEVGEPVCRPAPPRTYAADPFIEGLVVLDEPMDLDLGPTILSVSGGSAGPDVDLGGALLRDYLSGDVVLDLFDELGGNGIPLWEVAVVPEGIDPLSPEWRIVMAGPDGLAETT